jgi:PTS system mannose-specific IIA component
MIGIVIVTHGALAREFVSAVEHVIGPQDAISAICIGPDDDMDARRAEILAAVEDVDRGKGVIVLTDMFGGTPSNLAISMMGRRHVEVIAGVNLPMLIKLTSARQNATLEEAVSQAQDAGRKYINVASKVLAGTDR